MYACLCKGSRESEVVAAIKAGCSSLESLANQCEGVGSDCGRCRFFLNKLLTTYKPTGSKAPKKAESF